MLSVEFYCYAERNYAECRYAKSHRASIIAQSLLVSKARAYPSVWYFTLRINMYSLDLANALSYFVIELMAKKESFIAKTPAVK